MWTWAHEAALDGAKLSEVDERIVVKGTSVAAGKDSLSTAQISGRAGGSRVTGSRRDSLDITVSFGILVKKDDMAARSEVLEKAAAWAMGAENGAWLTLGHKQGRRIRVRLAQGPAEGDLWEWTNNYTIVLRAHEVPWWQDNNPTTVRRASTGSLSIQISVSGNRETVLDAAYTNGSGSTCNTLSISTGSATMAFSGLGLANGETLRIDHTADGMLRIRIIGTGGTARSAMAARTPASSDDLWIAPGVRTVAITAASGSAELSCYGRYI